jgi:glutamine synthetase
MPEAKWLIGGLVSFGAAMMAFGNRSRDSFVRLGQGKEAPGAVTWGRYNRRALVRIPIIPTDQNGRQTSPGTIEFRLPDGSAHPHLLLAGIAQAFVEGRRMPDLDSRLARTAVTALGQAIDENRVPLTFPEGADALAGCRSVLEAGGVFSPNMVDRVIALLRA